MKCLNCGNEYIAHKGALTIVDECFGPFTVQNLSYMKCGNCGDALYAPEAARKIEDSRKTALNEVIISFPINDFVSSSEAASMLRISRQALHKHRRIRRGFIFQTKFDGKTVYLKQSVLRFVKTGDGRFSLLGRLPMAAYSGWLTTTTKGIWEEVSKHPITGKHFKGVSEKSATKELAYDGFPKNS